MYDMQARIVNTFATLLTTYVIANSNVNVTIDINCKIDHHGHGYISTLLLLMIPSL